MHKHTNKHRHNIYSIFRDKLSLLWSSYINNIDILILVCINYAREQDSLQRHSWRTCVLFCDVSSLLIPTSNLLCFQYPVVFPLNKDMRLQHLLTLLGCQRFLVHGFKRVLPMELLHLLANRLLSLFTPLLKCSLEQHLCHHHSNNISTLVNPLAHQLNGHLSKCH